MTRSIVFALAFLVLTSFAQASEVGIQMEAGRSIPFTSPQKELFNAGGEMGVKAFFPLGHYFDGGLNASFTKQPASESFRKFGSAWAFGGGLRLVRPRDEHNFLPWLSSDLLFVRTGKLNRPGFALASGFVLPLNKGHSLWFGPFVRYFQIIQQNGKIGYDNRDARLFTFGLNVELKFGSEIECKTRIRKAPRIREKTEAPFLDRDHDGIKDDIDKCPDVAGLLENGGCPLYNGLNVKSDKIELNERIQFDFDSDIVRPESYEILSEVGKAMMDNPILQVQVYGYASAEGTDEHNLDLSERRAESVYNYLIAYGVPPERLVAKGFGEENPIAPNDTEAGRILNRRVEFNLDSAATEGGEK